MTLEQLISGEYCPISGMRIVNYAERIAPRNIHPPGHYATMQPKKQQPVEIRKVKSAPVVSSKEKDRKNYYKKWYKKHKKEKQLKYLQNRDKILQYYKDRKTA